MNFRNDPNAATTGERPDLEDHTDDLRHLEIILMNVERPLVVLEDRLDKALTVTTFTEQLAAMEGDFGLDTAELSPALNVKYERLIVQIAEATVLGECVPS